jgi:hypothetical protein
MRDILCQSNLDLLREIARLSSALATLSAPAEISTYQYWMTEACSSLRRRILQNLRDLELNRDDILNDILSETQLLTAFFRLCNQRLANPLLRHRPSDLLCLRIIAWLHDHHAETRDIPAGLSDGEFGIWPGLRIPIVYFMPSSRQRGLLYMPLFFHEFGHLLYAGHKKELDELVGDLQRELADGLEPISQRNDSYAHQEGKARNIIVETWYEWAQEIFCDAVGLTIGGPCFANAFSMYLRMGGRDRFLQSQERLAFSEHPVAWLRIRLLAERARQMGLVEADRLETEWSRIAATMGIMEEYYGYYDDRFLPSIRQTIDDMLIEASPYQFSAEDVAPSDWNPESSSLVHLLNRAWSIFLNDPAGYDSWEEQTISTFLTSTGAVT